MSVENTWQSTVFTLCLKVSLTKPPATTLAQAVREKEGSARCCCVFTKADRKEDRKEVLKWMHSFRHLDEVEFVGDSKEAMVSLVTAIVETRRRMNRKTHDQNNKPYQKGRTARVERFIQTVRNQTV